MPNPKNTDRIPVEIPPEHEALLSNLLMNTDQHAKTTQDMLGHQLGQNSRGHDLAATNIEMQAKTQDTIEKSGSEVANAVKELKPTIDAAGFIANFMAAIKGEKGDKGDDGLIGLKGDTGPAGADSIVQGPQGIQGEQGIAGLEGKVGKNGRDGIDGIDGDNAEVDIEHIIKEVIQRLPKPRKQEKQISKEEILKEVLKQIPDFKPTFPKLAGTGFLREISDVNTTGLINGQVLIWNSATNKWIPGTPAASGGAGFTKLSAVGVVDGSNAIFTFIQKPTYIISDHVWYQENKGWTFSGLTATMSVPPVDDIWGFV